VEESLSNIYTDMPFSKTTAEHYAQFASKKINVVYEEQKITLPKGSASNFTFDTQFCSRQY